MKTFIPAIIFAILLVISAAAICSANDKVAEDRNDRVERWLAFVDNMKYEREKIVSAIVRGKGERTLTSEFDGESITVTGPIEYFLAFDFAGGNMRVDRHELGFTRDGELERRLGQFVETRSSIEWCSSRPGQQWSEVIFVARPKPAYHELRQSGHCSPLDIRDLGHMGRHRFINGPVRSESPWFSDRMERIKGRIPEVFVEEENGIIRYEYQNRMEEYGILIRRVTWVDTKNGFTDIRHKSIYEYDSQEFQPRIDYDTRVSWKQKEGVWVPVEIIFDATQHGGPKPTPERLVMTFDWESLNEPVDDKYFSYRDFGLSNQSVVTSLPMPVIP